MVLRRNGFLAAFDAQARGLTFQIRDAGLLVRDVVRRVSPKVADRLPTRVITRVARIKGGLRIQQVTCQI